MKFQNGAVRISVVSHNQDDLVNQLLNSIAKHCNVDSLFIIVTRNTRTSAELTNDTFPFPVSVIQNTKRKGFGANHNSAFSCCEEEFFCVLNPDILFFSNIFDDLKRYFYCDELGVVAPALIDSEGERQDNARIFPTPLKIAQKIIMGQKHAYTDFHYGEDIFPDWVAGMFMLFRSDVFRQIGGFDERYYMYYEDADICRRLKQNGYHSQFAFQLQAIHNARRTSHRSLRHLSWHISSMLKFFCRYPFYTL